MYLTKRLFRSTIISRSSIVMKLSCWSCGKDVQVVSNLFCAQCKVIQKPDNNQNYFKLMGLDQSYDIDDSYLAKKYKDLQKYLHPDKFANRKKEELEISEKYSSLVNEAYKTLLEPLSRGIYLLQLHGHEMSENTDEDQTFLIKIMEKNEEVEEADSEEEIMKLNEENKEVLKKLQGQVSQAFQNGDLKLVSQLLSYMKYYNSIDSQIQSLIRRKGIIR